jgi:hypothetical protein
LVLVEPVDKEFPEELPASDYKDKLDWFYIVFFSITHLAGIYGLFMPGKSIWTTVYGNLEDRLNVATNSFGFPTQSWSLALSSRLESPLALTVSSLIKASKQTRR